VPVHLLSREAIRVYFKHVVPGGVLAFHVSNSALSLGDVVRQLAEDQRYASLRIAVDADASIGRSPSEWVVVSREPAIFSRKEFDGLSSPFTQIAGLRTWTDSYSTLLPILK
jgi:hypothetical protein